MDLDILEKRAAQHEQKWTRFHDLLERVEKNWPLLEALLDKIEQHSPNEFQSLKDHADRKADVDETIASGDAATGDTLRGTAVEGEFGAQPSGAQQEEDRTGADQPLPAGGHQPVSQQPEPTVEEQRRDQAQTLPDRDRKAIEELRAEPADAPSGGPRQDPAYIEGDTEGHDRSLPERTG